jgi:hypothetical protein
LFTGIEETLLDAVLAVATEEIVRGALRLTIATLFVEFGLLADESLL